MHTAALVSPGPISIFTLFDKADKSLVYFAANEEEVMGFVVLRKLTRGVGQEVMMTFTSPAHRGKRVASILYEKILNSGTILVSGSQQNVKSKRLWSSIINNDKFTVWAHDLADLSHYAPVYLDDGKICSSLKIYDDYKTRRRSKKRDVRMIAINPRKCPKKEAA